MDIRINKLTLHNFKGTRDQVLVFDGSDVEIAGRNGSGKSTVFDAFTWLLFGKDHRGLDWTNFDIKPIDPATREAIHHLDHYVEAELTIDGSPRTLRREIAENWVKPRGQADTVMQGHTQSFIIDGVACSTKRDYDTAVAQWISEDIFKTITNPLYLIDDAYTSWQDRRKFILTLTNGVDTSDINREFADVLAEINDTPLEAFRKKLAADKKANKAKLTEASANIKAWNNALPPEVNLEEDSKAEAGILKSQNEAIAKIRDEISDIDAAVLSANEANKARKAEIDAKWKEIYAVRDQMREMIAAAKASARTEYDARLAAIQSQKQEKLKHEQASRLNKELARSELAHIDSLEEKIKLETDALANLGVKYNQMRTRAIETPDTCPTCGQQLPEAMLQAKRQQLTADRNANIEKIKQEGIDIKARIAEHRKLKEEALAQLATYESESAAAFQKADAADAGLGLLDAAEPDWANIEAVVKTSEPYKVLEEGEARLTAEADAMAESNTDDTAAMLAKRHDLESQIEQVRRNYEKDLEPINARKVIEKERLRLLDMIKTEEQREHGFADEVARLERLEARTGEMVMATINAQTDAVNSLFKVARWKMFDTTLDGNPVEMCEVTNTDGVPYRSMNDAMKIICGLDVIRVISEKHNHTAPIFIDNAESVLQTSFDTAAQVIRLVVADTDFSINK